MFTVKSLDGSVELSRCESARHAIEKAGALWISTGGCVKISDAKGNDYTPDQFRSAYDPDICQRMTSIEAFTA